MKRRLELAKIAASSLTLLAAVVVVGAPARAAAGGMRVVDGQAYWRGDPGPIDPGPFWDSGQYKYDPNGYMDRINRSADQMHEMIVFADHSGKARCVFRKRVVVENWDYYHPYIQVCRR